MVCEETIKERKNKMINKNLIQKFADIEYPKCGDYETRRYG